MASNREILSLLKGLKKIGISNFKNGDVEVSFFRGEVMESLTPHQVKVLDDEARKAISLSEERERVENLHITDPLGFEESIMTGAFQDLGKQAEDDRR